MAIRAVLQYPDPRLQEVARAALPEEVTDELVADLTHTMLHGEREAIGLAAPQIGVTLRVFVMAEKLRSGRLKVHVCVNPAIIARTTGTMKMREGCLSFGELEYVATERAARVRLAYGDRDGRQQVKWFDGLLAVCAQHELDHLDGKLMVDHGELQEKKSA